MNNAFWQRLIRKLNLASSVQPPPLALPPCSLITPTAALAQAVQAAGGDPAGIAHWLTTDRGPVYRIRVPGEAC